MTEDNQAAARGFRAGSKEIMTASERQIFLRNSGYGRILGISGVHLPNPPKHQGDRMAIQDLRKKHTEAVIAKEKLEEQLIDSGYEFAKLEQHPEVVKLQQQLDELKSSILKLM